QTLCLSVGVVFAAVWDLSRLSVAIGVAAGLLFGLVAFPGPGLYDGGGVPGFLFVLRGPAVFRVSLLGSRPWCGWEGGFFVTVFLGTVFPVGVRYAFPGPTARLLRSTNERIIDPVLCRKYPFHGVAVTFFLFGIVTLFVVPMAFDPLRSPLV